MKLKIMASLLVATLTSYASNEIGDTFVMLSITRVGENNLRSYIQAIDMDTRPVEKIIDQAAGLMNVFKELRAVFDIDVSNLNYDFEGTAKNVLNNAPCIVCISDLESQENKNYILFKELICRKAAEKDLWIMEYLS